VTVIEDPLWDMVALKVTAPEKKLPPSLRSAADP
jgi:hypothetical protein